MPEKQVPDLAEGVPDSVLTDVNYRSRLAPAKWIQRGGILLLLVIVILGAIGFFGVHSRTTSAAAAGYRMTVTYPQVAQGGLDVPLRIRVHHPGGFSGDVTLAVTASYLRLFVIDGYLPDVSDSANDGTRAYLTFSPPPGGNDFVVDIDAHVKPSSQWGRSGKVTLRIDGRDVLTTPVRTWLVP